VDDPINMRDVHRQVADAVMADDLLDELGERLRAGRPPATHKQVAVIGAGPAGLSAAFYLALLGHGVTVYEKKAAPGGMLRYSLPMVLIGMAGIVNEMLDRAALKYLLPYDDATNMAQLGIYSAVFKLSVLMTLFIQAFRYAGEPFFFSYAKQRDAKEIYALVLTWFVIFCVLIFLLVTLFIDGFQYFIGEAYREGLHVVPVLLLANLLLGVYVNLSIWYKLTDRTLMGAGVALVGAGITVVSLWLLVPEFGYEGAAWAHLICYTVMVVLSYGLGRRYYPVPYEVLRVTGYIALGLGLYATGRWLVAAIGWDPVAAGTMLLALYLALVALLDGLRLLDKPPAAAEAGAAHRMRARKRR
jgi:O-antigen/teichoic acid export membrane protein